MESSKKRGFSPFSVKSVALGMPMLWDLGLSSNRLTKVPNSVYNLDGGKVEIFHLEILVST